MGPDQVLTAGGGWSGQELPPLDRFHSQGTGRAPCAAGAQGEYGVPGRIGSPLVPRSVQQVSGRSKDNCKRYPETKYIKQ